MSFISNHMVNNFWCSSYLYVDPVSIWNHFPSVWRTSFNISPRAGPLANHSFIHCCMSEKSLFHLHKEILLLWISNLNGSCFTFFFSLFLLVVFLQFEDVAPLFSGLFCFLQGINCHSHLYLFLWNAGFSLWLLLWFFSLLLVRHLFWYTVI